MRRALLAGLCAASCAALLSAGCGGKRISDLGGITGAADYRAAGIQVRLHLLTSAGSPMLWNPNNFTGGGVLSETELDTRVRVYSLRNGLRGEEVFAGRLRSLQWNAAHLNSYRNLLGVVPSSLIALDEEADGPVGELDVTLITPNQGEFETTIHEAQIYPASLFMN